MEGEGGGGGGGHASLPVFSTHDGSPLNRVGQRTADGDHIRSAMMQYGYTSSKPDGADLDRTVYDVSLPAVLAATPSAHPEPLLSGDSRSDRPNSDT